MSSGDDNIRNQAWTYVIGGLGAVVMAVIVIVVALCRQHCRKQAAKEQQKAARTARLLQLQQINSFSNVACRPDADILTRLGMAQPNPTLPQLESNVTSSQLQPSPTSTQQSSAEQN